MSRKELHLEGVQLFLFVLVPWCIGMVLILALVIKGMVGLFS